MKWNMIHVVDFHRDIYHVIQVVIIKTYNCSVTKQPVIKIELLSRFEVEENFNIN